MMTFCLECDAAIEVSLDVTIGERVTCPLCKIALEILNLDPLELDWVYDGPEMKGEQLSLYDQAWWSYPADGDRMGN